MFEREFYLFIIYFLFFKDFLYLFMREIQKEREAETLAEGEAGSTQGARHETRSQVSRIRPWAEGGAKLLSHPGCPILYPFRRLSFVLLIVSFAVCELLFSAFSVHYNPLVG